MDSFAAYIPSIIILLVFLALAVLMVTKKLPTLLAMPLMAVLIGLVASISSRLPWCSESGESISHFIFVKILTEGSTRLAEAMMYAVFGAILSQVVMKTGIAERIVKTAAELAGDRKILVAFMLTLATALVFTSLTGLGAFIMVGTLVLPVMMAAGISAVLASSLLLFGMAIGGIFNPVNWGFYKSALSIDMEVIKSFVTGFGVLLCLAAAVFLLIEIRKDREKFAWAALAPPEPASGKGLNIVSFLTPILPVFLILIPQIHWPIIPSFIAAMLFGVLTTRPAKAIETLTAATIEGLRDIGPVLGLFIGIGMVLNAVMADITAALMKPLLTAVIPQHRLGYILFFTLLAPLALYRGPLNMFGLGSGLAALLVSSKLLSPIAVMGAFISSGQIQSICDPTNTHNVWLAQYMKITTEDILKKTLIYTWVFVLIALLYAVFIRGVI